jgi:hypothetical protein
VAIGHGKKAARSIDVFLRGTGSRAAGKHAPASFGALNTWYYADAPVEWKASRAAPGVSKYAS